MSTAAHPIIAPDGSPFVAIALAIVITVAIDRRNGTVRAAP